ncbi:MULTISPECIES: pyruvate, water dikinase regulatory protein [Vibrio]|uniref:Pyruvate, water dikinase regulatory protein n=1 Tax=Vibrio bivalvicida TaxID=1276888 RepID=A0ABV4MPM2_9VIBR|nr:pyruvate, water dikinase regulatory protein [Vibrio aestuarianus]MDE1319029.1 kinase/pyrophosphorylase [Vibrio aestuarianus]
MNIGIFYVSDGTAITVRSVGKSVLNHFVIEPEIYSFPFTDTYDKAEKIKKTIELHFIKSKIKPIIFLSIEDTKVKDVVKSSNAFCIDVIDSMVNPIRDNLGLMVKPNAPIKPYEISELNQQDYDSRISAIDYTLAHDDGISLRGLDKADIILLGVSRSGKTPTSLYLAMQHGLNVVNYPFIPEDLCGLKLPKELVPYKDKLFGLTIYPNRLSSIRKERKNVETYANLKQCSFEVREVEEFYIQQRISYLDTSNQSVEEITSKIIEMMNLKSKRY